MNSCEIVHIPYWRIVEYPPKSGEFMLIRKKNWRAGDVQTTVFEEDDCIAYYQARRLTGKTFDKNGKVDFTDLFICVDLRNSRGNKLKDNELDNFEVIYKKGFVVVEGLNKKEEIRTRFVPFEASGNMTRAGRLMFVNEDYKQRLTEAITLLSEDEEPKKCSLSKWLSYKGLAMSSGMPAEGIYAWEGDTAQVLGAEIIDRVIVVRDCIEAHVTTCITSDADDESCNRVIKKEKQKTNWFDGAGLISVELAEKIRNLRDQNDETPLFRDPQFTSIQIRMPFCKGMLHEVDFKRFFKEISKPGKVEEILDVFGERHKIDDVDIILTESQFKAAQWFRNIELAGQKAGDDAWKLYRERFKLHDHRLFITGRNKTDAERGEVTQLNYQILSTLRLGDDAVRELVAEALRPYRQLKTDDEAMFLHFIAARDTEELKNQAPPPDDDKPVKPASQAAFVGTKQVVRAGLNTNARLIREAQVKQILYNAAKSIKEKAAAGKLSVTGKVRYLCPDLLRMMHFIAGLSMDKGTFESEGALQKWAYTKGELVKMGRFFAPGINSRADGNNAYSLTRSPHVAVNEHVVANAYAPEEENPAYAYFRRLEGVCMINPRDFFAERMGGADYDGDWVRIVHNPHIVAAAKEGPKRPWIKISAPKPIDEANTTDNRWETIKRSLNTRVGEFSNIAYILSAMAYGHYPKDDENYGDGYEEECVELLERMVMFIGREIDRVKTGAKVADVPNDKDYKKYLRLLKREGDFLKKKDYYLKHKGHKPGKSPAKQFLNELASLFEELYKPSKNEARFNTVPLSQLIKNGGAVEEMTIDEDKMKSLIALLLAYDGFKKAVRYGVYADIYEDEPVDEAESEEYPENEEESGIEDEDAAEIEDADGDDEDIPSIDEREYHFLSRIIRILTEQGNEDPKGAAMDIAKLFNKAEPDKLGALIIELRTKRMWALLTPKERREEELKKIIKACGAKKEIYQRKDIVDILCDFSLGGYNLLGYFLRYAHWRLLNKMIYAQLTPEGLEKASEALGELQRAAGEGEGQEPEEGTEPAEIQEYTQTLLEKQAYYKAQFGDSASKYGAEARKYFIDLRDAYKGKRSNIKVKCKEIAAEIFKDCPKDVVYAAMREAIVKYDRSHAFFWAVAGEAIIKRRLLVDYNKEKGFALPSPEDAGFEYKEDGRLHRYSYMNKNYTADTRRIE